MAPWAVAYQVPPSLGFPRQEYWSGLPFPSPGDLSHEGTEPIPPALAGGSFPTEPPGKLSAINRAHLGFLLPSQHVALAFTSQLSFPARPHSELTQDPELLS